MAGDGQVNAEYVPSRRMIGEGEIARVGLDLHPKIRPRDRDVQAMSGNSLDLKAVAEQTLDFFYLVGRNDKIEVQTNQRVGICVDALSADYTKSDLAIAEQVDQLVEEIDGIFNSRLPNLDRPHSGTIPSVSS